ncbi:MAG: lipopolysaccharide heptosyltransferase I [Casimicrobiaceae bacterium]
MNAVLVVRPSSFGDVVHALPVVADIAAHRPGVAVDWVAEEAFAPLVALHPGIRTVIPVALRRWRHHLLDRGAWLEFTAFRRALRDQGAYLAVLDLQEQVKGAVIARLARGPTHGFDRNSVRERSSTLLHRHHHGVARALHFEARCRALAGLALGYVPAGPPRYGLVPPPVPAGLLPAGPFAVCVHVTSRDDKRWADSRWSALIDALGKAGMHALLPWGTPEERTRSLALARGHDRAVVPERLSMPVLASVLAAAAIVIGVDTGLVHLAAALGTPTVGLFTRTDPGLAGVAIAGRHGVDVGGPGREPAVEDVLLAMGGLLRDAPRC